MSEVDKLKIEVYDQKKLAEKYWHEAREGWNTVTTLQADNKQLCEESTRLTQALRYALADLKAHLPGATHTIATCEAALDGGKGVQGGHTPANL